MLYEKWSWGEPITLKKKREKRIKEFSTAVGGRRRRRVMIVTPSTPLPQKWEINNTEQSPHSMQV
jgi:hypothetical protein